MSYEVIARRWRPQDFDGLIGQDHVRTTLLNALRNDRLHHALLLTGPRGTGKTSTARILAKALRCPNAVDFVPCNVCPECEEIAAGRSVNVIEIDGASNNGVDAIRELRDTVGYLPSSGRFKMYIIDEVHMLSTSAFNALLKTLEEPPPHAYFVMATTEVQKIPNTILSRCQRFDFRRIPTRVIAEHLRTICERDEVSFEPEALWVVARQGDGSMRDAQSLLDQVINFTDADLKTSAVVSTLGLTDRGLLHDLLGAIVGGDVKSVVGKLKDLHGVGSDPKLLLLDVMEQVRNALVLKISADTTLVDLPDSEKDALLALAQGVSQEDLHLLFDMALKGAQDLARAADPLLVLEMVLLRMTTAPRVDFASRGPGGGGGAGGGPDGGAGPKTAAATRPARRPPPPTPPPVVTTAVATDLTTPTRAPDSPVEKRFQELVERVKDVNGLVGAQLENCFVVRLEQKHVVLGVSSKHKFLFDKINQPDFKKKVLNYFNSFWGAGYTLAIELAEPGAADVTSPKALGQRQVAEKEKSLREAVEAHPLVRETQNVFKTEIKSIKEIKS